MHDLPPNLPPVLAAVLSAPDPASRERTWGQFLDVYSPLVLHAARSLTRDRDGAMDCYAYILEQLKAEDYRRLRAFRPDGSASFSSWLVVVARRLGTDLRRRRYGRASPGNNAGGHKPDHLLRRRLADLVAAEVDPDLLDAAGADELDRDLRRAELSCVLTECLDELEQQDRLLLSLRFREDLTAREIAAAMAFASPFHVYRRLDTVLGRLRHALEARGVHEAEP